MSTQIKYKNILGSFITLQQKTSLTDYKKLTYIYDTLKIIESNVMIEGLNYKTMSYFLDATEDKSTILNRYIDSLNKVKCILYFNKQSSYGFDQWDWESYSYNSELTFRGKEVFDSKGRMIMTCTFDLVTNSLQDRAVKYYYGNQLDDENDDNLFQFEYDQDGDLDMVFDVQENFGYIEGIRLETFLANVKLSQVTFPWDQHPYYHSALPYLPAISII
jgi:hypothetical protein